MSRKAVLSLLLSVIVFHIVNNYIWLKLDCISVHPRIITNTVFHLENQVKFYCGFKDLIHSDSLFFERLRSFAMFFKPGYIWPQPEWPGFVYFVTSIISLSFGLTPFVARFSNSLFFMILIVFTYLTGRECENSEAGLLAGFLVSFYPSVFGISRLYDLDFHLMAMVAACIYFLIKTERFTNRKYAVLLGVFSGLGILTKGQFLIFFAGPLVYIFYNMAKGAFHRKKSGRGLSNQIINTAVFFILSLTLSSVWLLHDITALADIFSKHFLVGYMPERYDLFGMRYDIFSAKMIFFHLLYLIDHVSVYFYILFCFSLFKVRENVTSNIKIVLMWVLVPLLVFTLMSAKWEHYYISALPGIAVLTAIGITRSGRAAKLVLTLSLLVFALFQFFIISYDIGHRQAKKIFFHNIAPVEWGENFYKVPFKTNNYERIIHGFTERIMNSKPAKGIVAGTEILKTSLGVIGITDAGINTGLISYYVSIYADDVDIWSFPDSIDSMPNASGVAERFSKNMDNLDFLIVATGGMSRHITINGMDMSKDLLSEFSYQRIVDNIMRRPVIGSEILLPNGKAVFLLGRTKDKDHL